MTLTACPELEEGSTAISSFPVAHFINGQFVDSVGVSRVREIENPAAGATLCEVAEGSAADAERAAESAASAFRSWHRTTPAERAAVLLAIADVIDSHASTLAGVESLNTGKPLQVARVEIPAATDLLRFMAGAARTSQSPAAGEYLRGHYSMIRREPVGVIGAIAPWNYPLLIASWKIAPALAAGNTVVLKPSELTPLTTLLLAELTAEVVPPGVLNVVLGQGPTVGAALSASAAIDMVTFTGSVHGGQQVATAASHSVKRLHLELGGKAPVIVFADADLEAAVSAIRMAGFWNSGQDCGAATRVLCDASVGHELTERLVAATDSLAVGDPREGAAIEVGPVISADQLRRVSGMVDRAVGGGAVRAAGGQVMDRSGHFFKPTVLTNVRGGSEMATQEVFGPVVSIETFGSEHEAVAQANAVDYGLAASVWTSDMSRALRITNDLDFGTVWVNTHLATAAEMPWVGFGGSGYGRDMSSYALDDHTRTKHVMVAVGDCPGGGVEPGEDRVTLTRHRDGSR
jgi:1-pyrroline dehydrogenase